MWRFEHCWVPLLKDWTARKQKGPLIAPLDVAWVWLCYLLHPAAYAQVGCASRHSTLLPSRRCS